MIKIIQIKQTGKTLHNLNLKLYVAYSMLNDESVEYFRLSTLCIIFTKF